MNVVDFSFVTQTQNVNIFIRKWNSTILIAIVAVLNALLCHMEVMGIPHSLFEEKLEELKISKGAKLDTDLTASDLKELVEQYKNVYLEATGDNFPSGAECNTANFSITYCLFMVLTL